MHIELKKIDKDTLKVGDVVGVAREVSFGWKSSFRHQLITPAKITRITPKRTKIETDQFGEHDKNEMGCRYECKKYGTKRFKCCIECEHYKYCNNRNSVCDRIHFHEYMEKCPDYVKEDEDNENH
jgi:hypothetical protein